MGDDMSDQTMDDVYEDESDGHIICPVCKFCKTCGDCDDYGCGQIDYEDEDEGL